MRLVRTAPVFAVAIVIGLVMLPLFAFAQAAAAPTDPGFAATVWQAIVHGEWWLVAGFALSCVVWAVKQPWSPLMRWVPWLGSGIGSVVLLAALALLGALGNSLIAGQAIGPALLAAVKVAGMAALTYATAKHATEAAKGKPDPDGLLAPGGS